MTTEVLEQKIIEDLFFEQDVDVLAISYKHGLLRTALVLARSLVFSEPTQASAQIVLASGTSVAVVFFPNEVKAASRAPAEVGIDRILHIDLHSMAIVREQLGWRGLVRESAHFVRRALAARGWRHVRRLTYPLLGWLLYRTFQRLLVGKTDIVVVTTNMQHPLSIGVAWAATSMQQASDFYEHATTPRAVVRDRSYRNLFVNFEHTRHMLIEHGFDAGRVHVLQAALDSRVVQKRQDIRRVGVCINVFDSLQAIEDITQALREHSLEIIYRVHDADPRLTALRRMASRGNAELSDARHSRIESFLGNVDMIIAGNSSVLADALMHGKPLIYYWSGGPDMFDYYGLVGFHNLPRASDRASLTMTLAHLVGDSKAC